MSRTSLSLAASIRQRQREGRFPVLSEIKVRSPKEGDLLRGRDPVALARTMDACAIAGLSVVTEALDFGGSLDIVEQVRSSVAVPILVKDFHKQPAQVEAAAAAGADVVLLTVSMMTDEQIVACQETAHRIGIETLVEIHTEADLERVVKLGVQADILGINNRDILIGETDDGDVSRTERLVALVPGRAPLLSESAIQGPEDARRARDAGADAVLVGTSILRAADTAQAIKDLVAVGWQ